MVIPTFRFFWVFRARDSGKIAANLYNLTIYVAGVFIFSRETFIVGCFLEGILSVVPRIHADTIHCVWRNSFFESLYLILCSLDLITSSSTRVHADVCRGLCSLQVIILWNYICPFFPGVWPVSHFAGAAKMWTGSLGWPDEAKPRQTSVLQT